MLTRLRSALHNTVHDASARTEALFHETTLRLAVTGLARAGKTVFVTSLITNLLALGRGLDVLPELHRHLEQGAGAGGASRLRSVRLVPPGSGDTSVFDHGRNLAMLTAEIPAWPPRTDDLTETAVELIIDRPGLRAHLGPKRLRLEILDYPGEWLLDLPMLEQSFQAWSRETLARLREPPRSLAFVDFLQQLPSVEANAAPDHERLRRLHGLYRDGLHACQNKHGLRLLQPGRFLCPGPQADAPFMWFFPLEGMPDYPLRGTAAALLEERFDAYKADMRRRFFEAHFARFGRQIVLVDVLGALHGGREAFRDTEQALALIAGSLSYGGRSFGHPRQGRIERVAFVATKADHVPAGARDNLCHLLRDLVGDASAPIGPRPVSFHTAASVLSTTDTTVEHEGLVKDVVRGTVVGGGAKLFDPGSVPVSRPRDGFWNKRRFVMPVFEPRRPLDDGRQGIEHLGLDEVLTALLRGQL
jgi:predicted YcjX-like family ATPase